MRADGITKTDNPFQRVAVFALGGILILGGIAGFLLPRGALIFAGIIVLSSRSTRLRRMLVKSRVWFPFLRPAFKASRFLE
jgi:hypothetical protein